MQTWCTDDTFTLCLVQVDDLESAIEATRVPLGEHASHARGMAWTLQQLKDKVELLLANIAC